MGLFSKKDDNMVCIHKHVDKDTIVAAIKNGADTYEKVKEATGAGTGICKGLRCKKKIEELIEEYK
ncbi:MAG: (2Fe-2S)-binding protein [Sarcina sp.]